MTYVKEKASFSGLLLRTYYVCDVTPFVKFRIKAQDNTVHTREMEIGFWPSSLGKTQKFSKNVKLGFT